MNGLNTRSSINNQNNFIQINGLTISQEQIQQLNAKQKAKIRDILSYKENDKIIRVIASE
jgi:hypothetical protein